MTTNQNSKPAKLWGGRFSEKTATSVEAFTASIHYDARLYRHDLAGSRAHAKMLAKQKLISENDYQLIIGALDQIEEEIENGSFEFRPELEDIHMNIEKALVEKIGPAGERLHTARSRNDQISLDIRLYLREESQRFTQLLQDVQKALVVLARKNLGVQMPGYTHLQRAQPVLVSHHMLAYYEMFGRDCERVADTLKRINVLPLGAAALAGTGLPIDREFVAKELDFPSITANSLDTVADRDFIVEFLANCSLTQIHLSRLSEELIIWASQEFSFVELADSYCTGSSIMPQKKNPDIPELIRGKSGRVVGNLVSLLTLIKGLPMAYNRDLQEDKEPLFDTIDTVSSCLSIMAELLANLTFNREQLANSLDSGFMTATDLADYLVLKEVPFRQAHAIVGKAVGFCVTNDRQLQELSLDELREFSDSIEEDVFEVLSISGSINSRRSHGGTALANVKKELEKAELKLQS
jgi:argininosuccinate lyase